VENSGNAKDVFRKNRLALMTNKEYSGNAGKNEPRKTLSFFRWTE